MLERSEGVSAAHALADDTDAHERRVVRVMLCGCRAVVCIVNGPSLSFDDTDQITNMNAGRAFRRRLAVGAVGKRETETAVRRDCECLSPVTCSREVGKSEDRSAPPDAPGALCVY